MLPTSQNSVSLNSSPDDLANFESSHDPANPAETFQHYQVLRRPDGTLWELGRGAMGVTYKAFDTNLRCYVALKVISGQHLHSEMAGQRFIREARVAAQLRHRNIATVYHLGVESQGFFYSMEFIDGETLEDLLERVGPLPVEVVLHVGLQTARALAVASRHGLIHRDIKPANLMVLHQDEDGEDRLLVKVIDFGLARSYDPASSNAQLTATGFVGTPLYASPEQLEERDLDIRSDIYSLGVTLWILLAGRPPFEGKMTQVITQHLTGEPPWWQLGSCPVPARALLERMLKKNPDDRFQTATDLRRAIEDCLRPWLNEAHVSSAGVVPTSANSATSQTPRPPTESESTDGFSISLGQALRRPLAAAKREQVIVTRSLSGAASGIRSSATRFKRWSSANVWPHLRLMHRPLAGVVVLCLGGLGFLCWHGATHTVEAKPAPMTVQPRVLAAPPPVQTVVRSESVPPEPAPAVETEPVWQPEVSASVESVAPTPPTPSSLLLDRSDDALGISSADLTVFRETNVFEMGVSNGWPTPIDPLFAPAPPVPAANPLNALVAAAIPWSESAADDAEEEDRSPDEDSATTVTGTRSKSATRRTRSRRPARSAPAPRPNFFQKLFGIKPKPKAK